MKDERMFLDRERVVDFLNVCIRNGRMAEAPGILMIRLGEELAAVCGEYYHGTDLPEESVLNRFERLAPADGQLRRALDRLLAVPSATGGGRLFHSPRHWLSVYKVFQFLGYMDDAYGCMARMERCIARLYADGVPPVVCRRDDLTKKNMDRPFNAPLRTWEQKRRAPGMENYWQIALHLLQFLHEECVTVCVTPDGHPQSCPNLADIFSGSEKA